MKSPFTLNPKISQDFCLETLHLLHCIALCGAGALVRSVWSTIGQRVLYKWIRLSNTHTYLTEMSQNMPRSHHVCGGGFGWSWVVTSLDFRSRKALPSQAQLRLWANHTFKTFLHDRSLYVSDIFNFLLAVCPFYWQVLGDSSAGVCLHGSHLCSCDVCRPDSPSNCTTYINANHPR